MGNDSVRLLGATTMGSSTGDYTIQQNWHADYSIFTGSKSCDNGLVMWLPMEWPSEREANGLVMARGSNRLLEQMINNKSLTPGVGMRGQLNLLNMYKSIADSYPVYGPSLSVGDVLVFSKCTVHSCSGSNRLKLPRHAWQLRLISGNQGYDQPTYSYPEMGSKFVVQGKYLEGPNHMKIWPETVPSEDELRRKGHMTLTKTEWALHMLSFPHHLAVSCFVRASEELGLFKPHHPIYQMLVSALEFICIL